MSDIDNLERLAGELRQGATKFSDAAQTLRQQAQRLDWSSQDLTGNVNAWAGDGSTNFQTAWRKYHQTTQQSATALDNTSQALSKLAQKIEDAVQHMRQQQASQSWVAIGLGVLTVGLVVADVLQLGLDPATDAATVAVGSADAAAVSGAEAAAGGAEMAANGLVEADAEIAGELDSIEVSGVTDAGDIGGVSEGDPGSVSFDNGPFGDTGGGSPGGTGGRLFDEPGGGGPTGANPGEGSSTSGSLNSNDPGAFGNLAGQEFQVTEENLQTIETHLSDPQFLQEDGTMYPENVQMIDRLQTALAEGRPISGADASFYFHELYETSLMDSGMSYEEAHAAALAEYGVSPFSVYAPEVVESLPESFNQNWFNFWNLGGK